MAGTTVFGNLTRDTKQNLMAGVAINIAYWSTLFITTLVKHIHSASGRDFIEQSQEFPIPAKQDPTCYIVNPIIQTTLFFFTTVAVMFVKNSWAPPKAVKGTERQTLIPSQSTDSLPIYSSEFDEPIVKAPNQLTPKGRVAKNTALTTIILAPLALYYTALIKQIINGSGQKFINQWLEWPVSNMHAPEKELLNAGIQLTLLTVTFTIVATVIQHVRRLRAEKQASTQHNARFYQSVPNPDQPMPVSGAPVAAHNQRGMDD